MLDTQRKGPRFSEEEGVWFDPRKKGPSVFFLGVGGFGGIALKEFIALGASVVGVCTRPDQRQPITALKRFAKRVLRVPDFEQIIIDHFKGTPSPYRLARRHRLAIYELTDLSSQMLGDIIAQARPDFIVSAGFPKLIPPHILGSARIAALNFHPGLLPERAGATPVRTAIMHGDAEAGLTVHHMSENFDSGSAVFTECIPVEKTYTYGLLELKLSALIPRAVATIISDRDKLPEAKLVKRAKLRPKV